MRNLEEDREEVTLPRLRSWIARKRREHGIAPDEPTTWFADYEAGRDRALVSLGRSPADVLMDASITAQSQYGVRRGTGRWLIDNRAGEEDADSTFLIVYPRLDPYADTTL